MTTNIIDLSAEKQIQFSDFLSLNKTTITQMQTTVEGIHAEVNQHYDELPYSFHTNMVAIMFMQYGSVCFESRVDMEDYGLVAIFAALFHDTIEDARLTYNDVKRYAERFLQPNLVGKDKAELAADIVFALTNEKGKTRADRENDKYFEGILATPYAPCIKMCDRYANALYANVRMSSMSKAYAKEMKNFLEHLVTEEDVTSVVASRHIPKELYFKLNKYPFCGAFNN